MKKLTLKFLLASLVLVACEGPEGQMGLKSLVKIEDEPVGLNCINGGLAIKTGIDLNNNNSLEDNEVEEKKFLCNGSNGSQGLKSLIRTTSEPSGTNCVVGGIKVEVGSDLNGNGILDMAEIETTRYVCNGTNGMSGIDGANSLIKTSLEPNGTNCEAGGYKLEIGRDQNHNGLLDLPEVEHTIFICNGYHVELDKQTRVNFGVNSHLNDSDQWVIDPIQSNILIKFDKRNYSNIKNIVFCTSINTYDANVKAYVDLFNLTDNLPVAGSEINSNRTDFGFECSADIAANLPDKEVSLTVRVRSEVNGKSVAAGIARLLIINKN